VIQKWDNMMGIRRKKENRELGGHEQHKEGRMGRWKRKDLLPSPKSLNHLRFIKPRKVAVDGRRCSQLVRPVQKSSSKD
jgi:hypothetical protein